MSPAWREPTGQRRTASRQSSRSAWWATSCRRNFRLRKRLPRVGDRTRGRPRIETGWYKPMSISELQKLSVYSEEFDCCDALNNEKAPGVQASACDFKLRP